MIYHRFTYENSFYYERKYEKQKVKQNDCLYKSSMNICLRALYSLI
jgi:hypothetical protein